MTNKKIFLIGIFAILVATSFVFAATYSFSNPQLSSVNYNYGTSVALNSLDVNKGVCEKGQDFIVQVSPLGCSPTVVTSDLLEEQNVPVFCALSATQINPLIKVDAIKSMTFKGELPEEVSGVGFHPARAAIDATGRTLLNSPILENIGYAVIVLKEQKNESSMPDFVSGTLTANIKYDIENTFGVGKATFHVPELTSEEWENEFSQYGFWRGKGYLKVDSIGDTSATLSVYSNKDTRLTSTTLSEGKTSSEIDLPGFYCLAGVQLRLDDLENPKTRARFEINGDIVEAGEGEKFLDNKCSIPSGGIDKRGLAQSVTFKCATDSGTETTQLVINPIVTLDIGGINSSYRVGDYLYLEGDKAIYLAYIGAKGDSTDLDDVYVILMSKPIKDEGGLSDSDLRRASNFDKLTRGSKFSIGVINFASDLAKLELAGLQQIFNILNKGEEFIKIPYTEDLSTLGKIKGFLNGVDLKIVGFASPVDVSLDSSVKQNYENAMADYRTIIDSYPNAEEEITDSTETTILSEETYGEQAFFNAIQLAYNTNQKKSMIVLCDEFKEKFPDSETKISECEDNYRNSNQGKADKSVSINGGVKDISFKGIYEPSYDEFGVTVNVRDASGSVKPYTLTSGAQVYLSEDSNEYIELRDLTPDTATIRLGIPSGTVKGAIAQAITSSDVTLKKNEGVSKGNYVFTLTDIKLERVAKVSVIPKVENTGTEANFSFNIGIEKRAIQLTPDEVEDRIEDLDNLIEDWTKISSDLGNTVKTFNAACLSTGVLLTVKNFFDNTDGKSIARNKVMRSDGGWVDLCREAVSTKKLNGKSVDYSTINDCLLDNNDAIESDVETMYNSLKDVSITEENKDKESKFIAESLKDDKITNPANSKEILDITAVKTMLNYEGADNTISYSDLRDLKTIQNALDNNPSDGLERVLLQERYKLLYDINANVEAKVNEKSILDEVTQAPAFVGATSISTYGSKDTTSAVYDGLKTKAKIGEIEQGTPYQIISYNNQIYVVTLEKSSGNNYIVTGVYDKSGVKADEKNENVRKIQNSFTFKFYDSTSYENPFKDAEVKYFETAPYKGMPALVPFDLTNGWYVAMKQTVSSGALNTYTDAGAVSSFYLCNVGANGKAEFTSTVRDDDCRLYLPGTGRVVSAFPNIKDNEADKLVSCAIDAVSDAARAYSSGVTKVNIQTSCGRSISVSVGNPEVGVPEIQCQDFMSPEDCNILFNVCDPVVCPSSRCDLGGTYHVDNVVASGIIGSIALCLPNFRENVIVPVCLTGLKAGIDELVSLFDATRSCLQTQLDSGENVGICDEIQSIYLCQFFWEQALPLTENLAPQIFASILGKDEGTRGGGEYLGVQTAWDNAQDSVGYLSQYYGRDITNAFKVKATEEIGGAVCKNFISANYPASGEVLDSLIEPASPPQFTASFEETTFTTATVPPTSHYKVYYHIYAGEESKAYYRVYLKSPQGSSLYTTNPTLTVASGFIDAGDYVDEAPDFTATTGYQELCVSINGEENCGFKQVTSNFAVNYLKDAYAAEQSSQAIETTEDCVSGTPSAYSLVQLNLQSAISDLVNPSIYELGITRVCSSASPGKNTDADINNESARWKPVGSCDDGLTCYLDTQSVRDVITSTELEGEALGEITSNYINTILKEGDYLDFAKEIEAINKLDDTGKTNYITETLIGKAFFNYQKAKLYLIRGDAYASLANLLILVSLADSSGEVATSTTQLDNLNALFANCEGQYDGQCDVAKELVKIAREKKSEIQIDESTIKEDTSANCFEELVLMQAMQESGIKHCNGDFTNDLTCDGNPDSVLKGDDGISFGVMQVNTKANPDAVNMENFEANVRYGINHLIKNYNSESKSYGCRNVDYSGWQRALRYYNGWNTDCEKGNIYYVDSVLSQKPAVESLFGDVCETTTTLDLYPIFEYAEGSIIIDPNVFFTFTGTEWVWDTSESDVRNGFGTSVNEDIGFSIISRDKAEFIPKFRGKSYEEGLKLLLDKVVDDGSPSDLYTTNVLFSAYREFTITQNAETFYLQNDGRTTWRYSEDGSTWNKDLANSKYSLAKQVDGKTLYEGAKIIFNIDGEEMTVSTLENAGIKDIYKLNNQERTVVTNAKSCEDCGGGVFNNCDETECEAINTLLGGNACKWDNPNIIFYECVEALKVQEEIGGSRKDCTSNIDLNEAIEKSKELTGTYSDNKDFVDELYNCGILTHEEYIHVKEPNFLGQEKSIWQLQNILQQKEGTAVTKTSWTIGTALDKINEFLKDPAIGNVEYSDNEDVKKFIDEICSQELINEDDCGDIKGIGFFGLADENLEYVRNLLRQNQLAESQKEITSLKSDEEINEVLIEARLKKQNGISNVGAKEFAKVLVSGEFLTSEDLNKIETIDDVISLLEEKLNNN